MNIERKFSLRKRKSPIFVALCGSLLFSSWGNQGQAEPPSRHLKLRPLIVFSQSIEEQSVDVRVPGTAYPVAERPALPHPVEAEPQKRRSSLFFWKKQDKTLGTEPQQEPATEQQLASKYPSGKRVGTSNGIIKTAYQDLFGNDDGDNPVNSNEPIPPAPSFDDPDQMASPGAIPPHGMRNSFNPQPIPERPLPPARPTEMPKHQPPIPQYQADGQSVPLLPRSNNWEPQFDVRPAEPLHDSPLINEAPGHIIPGDSMEQGLIYPDMDGRYPQFQGQNSYEYYEESGEQYSDSLTTVQPKTEKKWRIYRAPCLHKIFKQER